MMQDETVVLLNLWSRSDSGWRNDDRISREDVMRGPKLFRRSQAEGFQQQRGLATYRPPCGRGPESLTEGKAWITPGMRHEPSLPR